MNEIDELRAQMLAMTAHDSLPADMPDRVRAGLARRRRRHALTVVAVAALALGGGALLTVPGGDDADQLRPAVTAVPQVPPTDDQIDSARWWSWATDYYQQDPAPAGNTAFTTSRQRNWVARDGRTLLSSSAGEEPVQQPGTSDAFAKLAAEPTDAVALRSALVARSPGTALSAYVIPTLWGLLHGPAPLAFREAAVQVLRDEPGLARATGTDALGRSGLLFRSTTAEEGWQIIIDKASSRTLEVTYQPVYEQAPGVPLQRWTESDWSVADPPAGAGD